MRINKRETITITVDGAEAELQFEPSNSDDILTERVGDTLVVAYLVVDTDVGDIKDLMGDGMGEMYSFHRWAKADERQKGLEAIGCDRYGNLEEEITPDKDAVLLDYYEHGGQMWSVAGGGMQCQFDTTNGAGVWVPDQCLREQLDSDEANGLNRHVKAVEYCKQFLEEYNSIINGEVYGCVTQTYELDGDEWTAKGDFDACWNFVGHDYAMETLKSEYLDGPVARLKAQVAA